jgi:hypothetical protein
LLAELASVDADRLPARQCETLDASALARELAGLLADGAALPPSTRPGPTAALLAAALLLCGAAVSAGCGSDKDSKSDCADDLGSQHFATFVDQASGLTSEEAAEAESEYSAMDRAEKRETMTDLCGMSATEIASYIKAKFIDDNLDDDNDGSPDDDDNDNNDNDNDNDNNDNDNNDSTVDDDAAYKGVSF